MRRAITAVRGIGQAALDALAPQTCVYCQQASDQTEAICTTCFQEFRRNADACPRCALPDCNGSLCPTCQSFPSALDQIVAPFVYDPAIAFLLRRWKYEKQRYCSEIAANMLLNSEFRPRPDDIVLPTPLHWYRGLRRGFNQSEDLLRALSRRLDSIITTSVDAEERRTHRPVKLRRARATPKQSLATRDQRRGNLAGAFRVSGDVQGRSFVLIDDVCTTGATGESMATALRDAGAVAVRLWCVARTPSPR